MPFFDRDFEQSKAEFYVVVGLIMTVLVLSTVVLVISMS